MGGLVRAALVMVAMAFAFAACDLTKVPEDECGNGVVESGEACDSALGFVEGECGEPSSERACLILCDAFECPVGHACGANGVCSRGTGAFALKTVREGGDHVAIADFDGDGINDVLTTGFAKTQVFYGPDLEDELSLLRSSSTKPAVGDFDRDGNADMADAIRDGKWSIRAGTRDRQLDTRTVPAFPLGLETAHVAELPEVLPIFLPISSPLLGIQGPDNAPCTGGELCLIPVLQADPSGIPTGFPASELAGTLVSGILDTATINLTEEHVVVFGAPRLGATELELHRRRGIFGDEVPEFYGTFQLPDARIIGAFGATIADMDGDGSGDLFVDSGPGRAAIGYGQGEQLATDAGCSTLCELGMTCVLGDRVLQLGSPTGVQVPADEIEVVGVGRVGRGPAAIVTSKGLYMPLTSSPQPCSLPPHVNFGWEPDTRWDFASFGDVDADGDGDVAVAGRGGSTVDLFRGGESLIVTRNRIVVPGTVEGLKLADFDADNSDDLAVVVDSPVGTLLWVYWGSPEGIVADGVRVAAVARFEPGGLAAPVFGLSVDDIGASASLLVVSRKNLEDPDTGELRDVALASLLATGGTRLFDSVVVEGIRGLVQVARVGFETPPEPAPATAMVAGQFYSDDDLDFAAWHAVPFGPEKVDPPPFLQDVLVSFVGEAGTIALLPRYCDVHTDDDICPLESKVLVSDVDGDGFDELLSFVATVDGSVGPTCEPDKARTGFAVRLIEPTDRAGAPKTECEPNHVFTPHSQ